MAKPVPLQLPPRDPREEMRARLERAPLEHADALLATYEVLQGLHDSGLLEVLRGLLGSSDKVLETAVDAARAPESVRTVRNLMVLIKMLGEIDPDLFDGFALALPEAMQHAREQGKEPPGLLAILNKFRSRDLRRGLVAINALLEAWGREFFSEAHSKSQR
ncbi:MAG: hypothetical protein JWN92_535 [Candidatus Acidoferrum typicum]|jgi:uncharacterized protein YjgD (DUF1641 family)|nr:hypothetical protein [Candidatus Acidoferrum typicum]